MLLYARIPRPNFFPNQPKYQKCKNMNSGCNIQGVPPKTGHFWAAAARPVTQLPRRSSSHRMQNLQELLLRGGATRSDVFWPRYRVFSKKVGFFLQISIKLIFDIFRGLLKLHFWMQIIIFQMTVTHFLFSF